MTLLSTTGKKRSVPAFFSVRGTGISVILILLTLLPSSSFGWTIQDYNPWKQLRERKIFSLTRSNPIGTRILVIPVLDEPANTPVYTRVCTEFTQQLRSFTSEVWLITDLPEGPVKQGLYSGMSRIIADYKLKNRLSMNLISTMIPDFECDFIALFEVTSYDRYWIDHDLQHKVALRCVLYDYGDGGPRVEKYFEGGRGRRLEEGAFSEAERIAVKGLVDELERPLRRAVEEREKELQLRYQQIGELAALTNQQEWAIHQYDLGLMQGRMAAERDKAAQAEQSKVDLERQLEYWKQQAESNKEMAEQYRSQAAQAGTAQGKPMVQQRWGFSGYGNPFMNRSRFFCPPGSITIPKSQAPPPNLVPIEEMPPPPREEPTRAPTIQPIDLRGQSPSRPDSGTSSIIAFRSYDELPEYELKTGSALTPPWEKEPQGDWEYVGPEPE